MYRKLIFLISFAMLLSVASSVQALEITTAVGNGADTYLSNDDQNDPCGSPDANHGLEGAFEVRTVAGIRQKIAYLRFDTLGVTQSLAGAVLRFNVTSSTRGRVWGVYGMVDESKDTWNEATITYNNAPGIVPNPPTALGYYAIDTNLVRLADFPVEDSAGVYYSEPNALMDAFIAADTDSRLTFAVIYETDSNDTNPDWWMTSKEGDANLAPALVVAESATNPFPGNNTTGAPRNPFLRWSAPPYADRYDVYFGTNFNDVNDANRSIDPCNVLVSQNQSASTYDPCLLDAYETYYWRIDLVNLPFEPNIVKGNVWNFTTHQPFMVTTAGGNGADTYLSNDGQSGNYGPNDVHGDSTGVQVRTCWTIRLKIGYLRFDLTHINKADLQGAMLSGWFTWSRRTRTLGVFGLADGLDNWDEATTTYNNAPGVGHNPPDALGTYTIDANLTRLADLDVVQFNGGPEGVGWYSSDPNLDAFINADTDNLLTFAVIYETTSTDTNPNWTFTSKEGDLALAPRLFVPLPTAQNPYPNDRAGNVPRNVVLKWTPGRLAATHNVYFDPCEQNVIDRNGCDVNGVSTTNPYYAITPPPLNGVQTYYWAVDEVNNAETPPVWEGDVWEFTTGDYLVVDDFDSYANDAGLKSVWKDYTTQPIPVTRAEVFVETGLARDGNSTRYYYGNNNYPYYSEARANVAGLPSSVGPDWSAGAGAEVLVLYFNGVWNNDANEQMYVALTDGGGNTGTVEYSGDTNNITLEGWHEWDIDLQAFVDDNDVNLADIAKMTIGFGDGVESGADANGTVYFDSIELRRSGCYPAMRSTDFGKADYAPTSTSYFGDCVIDYQEIERMAGEWLLGTVPSTAEEIWREAESANTMTPPMRVWSNRADASGGQYIAYQPPWDPNSANRSTDPCGVASYNFTVNGGTYKICGRMVALDGTHDSLWFTIPGVNDANISVPTDVNGWIRADVWEGLGSNWTWDELNSYNNGGQTVEYTLDPGSYTLKISYRERTLIDRLLITDDLELDESTLPPLPTDLNNDGKVNFKDFASVAAQWLIEEQWP